MRTLVIAVLFLASSVAAGEVLDNAAVLRLVAAGLPADVIVLKIERSETRFDTSTGGLIALKDGHVPDRVIRAMLLRGDVQSPSTPAATPPPGIPTSAAPALRQLGIGQPASSLPAANQHTENDGTCATVKFFTLAAGGWGWAPSYVCVGPSSVSVDEQEIPFAKIVAQCTSKPPLLNLGGSTLRGDQEWWFSDDKETLKFQGKPEELELLAVALTHARRDLPHGGCNDRAVRKLLR